MGTVQDNAEKQALGRQLIPLTRSNSRRPTSIYPSVNVLDKNTDFQWAYGAQSANGFALETYFDYFYSGTDVKIFIDGAEILSGKEGLPIMQFAFNIEQQKTPLYGAWSYTYDGVLKGTRIVRGAFSVSSQSVDRMTNLIAAAAESRQAGEGTYLTSARSSDLENIDRYWSVNIDSALKLNNNRHIFSSHPPFNIVIVYGLQPGSLAVKGATGGTIYSLYDTVPNDQALTLDVNERLVEAGVGKNRRILESVEITNMQQEIGTDGQPIAEMYSFFARDTYIM